jgi:hypothetical protein
MQVANFLVTGSLLVGSSVGVRRADERAKWLPRLVVLMGVGLVGAGVFACDPVGGYPHGTPWRPSRPSTRGALHQFFSAFVFLGMPAAFVIEARNGSASWSAYSKMSFVGFVATFAASSAGFAQAPGFVRLAGLFQRLALSIGFTWLTLHAARLLHPLPEA